MAGNSFKHRILGAVASNTYAAAMLYKVLASAENAPIISLVREITGLDTIADPYSLLEIKQRFERGVVSHSKDKNFNNTMIYGYWRSLFPDVDDSNIPDLPAIEHGLILADDVFEEIVLTGRCTAVTFGGYRQGVIREKAHIPAFSVGPYIQYAKPFYSLEQFRAVKEGLGKTLLVFPGHSTDRSEVTRNVERQIREIDASAAGFDSVLISTFWWDLDDPILNVFEAHGYKVVCAGFRDDPSFISRQRTIIELSDAVLSDGIGTHVGFSRTFDKPIAFFSNKSSRNPDAWAASRRSSIAFAENEIARALKGLDERVADDIFDKYWGLGIRRSSEELKVIQELSREITERSKGFRADAIAAAEDIRREALADNDGLKCSLLADALGIGGCEVSNG